MPGNEIAVAPSELTTYTGQLPTVPAGLTKVIVTGLTTVTEPAVVIGDVPISTCAPVINPDPVNVIVCPPAGSAAVSSPG